MGWITQVDPSQRSPNVTESSTPTAAHSDGALHETPIKPMDETPGGLGVDWIVQPVPSQASAIVTVESALLVDEPTAVHADGVVQETPRRSTDDEPAGVGVDCIVQLVPSQRSANAAAATPGALISPTASPTAMQEFGDVHDTLLKLSLVCGVFTVDCIVQLVPSQTSANAAESPPGALY